MYRSLVSSTFHRLKLLGVSAIRWSKEVKESTIQCITHSLTVVVMVMIMERKSLGLWCKWIQSNRPYTRRDVLITVLKNLYKYACLFSFSSCGITITFHQFTLLDLFDLRLPEICELFFMKRCLAVVSSTPALTQLSLRAACYRYGLSGCHLFGYCALSL